MSFANKSLKLPTAEIAHQEQRLLTPNPPSQIHQFLAKYRTPIVGGTVVAHVAHHQYLTKVKGITSSRTMTIAGGVWAAAYVGVLSATTIAESKMYKSTCPIEAGKQK